MAQNCLNKDKVVNQTGTKHDINYTYCDEMTYFDTNEDLDHMGIDHFIDNNFDFMKELVQHIEGKPVDVSFQDSVKSIDRNAIINDIFRKRMEFLKKK